jgi:ribosome-binding factor A
MPSRRQSPRTRRVADRIQVELGEILAARTENPRLRTLTVTGVEVTRDLSIAKIWVASGSLRTEDEAHTLRELEKAAPYFRTLLAPRLKLRIVPALHFEIDHSIAEGARIDQLLREIQEPRDE